MPFFTHVFEDNVFNIIKLNGDPELQHKIQQRQNNVNPLKDTIVVPHKFNKMIELVQTRRDIWYIGDEKWKVTTDLHEPGEITRPPGTLHFYENPELKDLCNAMIVGMTEKYPELNDRYFLRIQIIEFNDKGEDGSEVMLKISYFP